MSTRTRAGEVCRRCWPRPYREAASVWVILSLSWILGKLSCVGVVVCGRVCWLLCRHGGCVFVSFDETGHFLRPKMSLEETHTHTHIAPARKTFKPCEAAW